MVFQSLLYKGVKKTVFVLSLDALRCNVHFILCRVIFVLNSDVALLKEISILLQHTIINIYYITFAVVFAQKYLTVIIISVFP